MQTRIVMQKKPLSSTSPRFTPLRNTLLQRTCACGGSPGLNGMCEACRTKRLSAQRDAINSPTIPTTPPLVDEVLHSSGQPLNVATRTFLESRFGHDFSAVRVHTDAKASESARGMNALAYTIGKDIVFRTGQYRPETREGQRLIAHELTHVIQQGGNTYPFSSEPRVTHSGDTTEQEAEGKASAIMQGHSVGSLSHSDPQIARQASLPGTSPLSVQEENMIAYAQSERYRVLSLALVELNTLARASRMNPDPTLLASAFGLTLAKIAFWLDVSPGQPAPPTSYLGQSGSDYFTDVVDVAVQHIRDNLAHNEEMDKADPVTSLCANPRTQAFYSPIFGGIHFCDRAFNNSIGYLGALLIHENFHAINLIHGEQEPLELIDPCAFSSTTEEKLDNPYCMTGLIEHIVNGQGTPD